MGGRYDCGRAEQAAIKNVIDALEELKEHRRVIIEVERVRAERLPRGVAAASLLAAAGRPTQLNYQRTDYAMPMANRPINRTSAKKVAYSSARPGCSGRGLRHPRPQS